MKRIDINELKQIQLDVLSAIHGFCIEHGIRYSLGCGTMLGCARHQGYIPWDDDIDIYLPREDYNKLVNEFPETLNGKYQFISLERDSKWNRAYGKAFDNRTVLRETVSETVQIGVNIDVFPIDDVPDDEQQWNAYNKTRVRLQKLYAIKTYSPRSEWSICKKLGLAMGKHALLAVSSRLLAQTLQKMAVKHNGKGFRRVFECCQGLFESRSFPFKKSLFDNLKLMPFEDREFFGFEDYDEYLTNCYGDWRQLPPKEKQVANHIFNAWWKQ